MTTRPDSVSLQTLYGRPGVLRLESQPSAQTSLALTNEVVARVDQALRSQRVDDLPSTYARELYRMLTAHGLDRGDLLAVAASLVDLVASDVSAPSSDVS